MSRNIKMLQIGKAAAMGKSCACCNLRKAARAVTQVYDELLKPTGLRTTQFSLLAAIRVLEPATLKRLAEATVMDRTTLTRNLKPLKKQGLIRIAPGEDLRERRVSLTDQGHRILAEAFPGWERAQAKVAEGLGSKRFRRLLSDLEAIVAIARKD